MIKKVLPAEALARARAVALVAAAAVAAGMSEARYLRLRKRMNSAYPERRCAVFVSRMLRQLTIRILKDGKVY